MRTSRLAKDTAKVASLFSSSTTSPRRTRSSLGAVNAPLQHDGEEEEEAESPSSALSDASFDIEDVPSPAPGKRKRGDRPLVNGVSANLGKRSRAVVTKRVPVSTRESPRKVKRAATKSGAQKEEEDEEKEDVETEEGGAVMRKPRRRRPAREVVDPVSGEVSTIPPEGWEEVYNTTREMRKRLVAAVDTMGCERAADERQSPKDQRFQILISLMLSSQTKDTTNFAAMQRLRTELPAPGLTLANIRAVAPERLNSLIWSVGFHNNKTRYIKAVAEILAAQYDGDIPSTAEGLMALPGVGPKMAYLCLSAAWGRTEGIGVDVHVHRITNLWGWHRTAAPEDTRRALQAWLPRDRWHEINGLLVGLGQTVCLPVGRKCGLCDLAAAGICPGAVGKGEGGKTKAEKTTKTTGGVKRETKGETKSVAKREVEFEFEAEVGVGVRIEAGVGGEPDVPGPAAKVEEEEDVTLVKEEEEA